MISLIRQGILLCMAMLLPAALMAQAPGSIHGQITDPSNAAIPKASVTVTGSNNVVKVAQTDNDGVYAIADLPPGTYTVRIIAPGFNLLEKTDVAVPAGRALTFDAHLIVAAEKQEVTVTTTQQVELDPAANAGALVLKQEDLDMLPDDPDDLQADLLALAGPAAGPNGGQLYIDGFSNGELPPKESIREIRINSNPFSSEFDAPGYGRIQIFTKPGSDKFRGMVQFNYGDSLWNARNPYSPEKPFYDTKNLNANLSGPLIKNKLSFFIDFARRDMRDSDLINAQILNPVTFLPSTLAESVIAPSLRTNISPRFDYQLTPNITLTGRYSLVTTNLANQGIGGIDLPSTAYSQTSTNQTYQLTETQVVNTSTINETRFQYYRQRQNQLGDNPVANVTVTDEFATGSNFQQQYTNNDNYELQNYTSITHGAHFIKFGARLREATAASLFTTNYTGQFVFDSIAAYATTLQNIAQGLAPTANGGGASQFIIAGGNPLQKVSQFDAGLFFQDDWKVKPSLTVSLGARYEIQQNISDYGDWEPRIGFAWGLGPGQGRLRQPKTVLRGGYGWFYTRFPIGDVLQAERYNGINQLQYIVTDPSFYSLASNGNPIAPPISSLTGSTVPLNTYKVDSNLDAGRLMQAAIGIDRQLPKNTTLSINYINSRGLHQLRTVNINTPLPGTYSIANPSGAVYPYAPEVGAGVLDLYESSGNFKQQQLIVNINARVSSRFTMFGYYVYGHAYTDVLGQPSNPYNFAADWGRSNYDVRHRVNINGSILLPFGIRLSPNITASSALPLNIVEGVDQFGDTVTTNARPAFVPQGFSAPMCNAPGTAPPSRTGAPCIAGNAQYGMYVVNPLPGMTVIPPNYGVGFAQINVNIRVSRTWGFGESAAPTNRRPPGGGMGGGGPRGGPGGGPRGLSRPGGGGGFFGGGDASGKKYTVTLGAYVRNIFNTVNQGPPEGDLLSPRFGETLQLANAGGGATQSANRRMELTLRFSF